MLKPVVKEKTEELPCTRNVTYSSLCAFCVLGQLLVVDLVSVVWSYGCLSAAARGHSTTVNVSYSRPQVHTLGQDRPLIFFVKRILPDHKFPRPGPIPEHMESCRGWSSV